LNPTRQTAAPAVERTTEIKPFIADYNQENGAATDLETEWLWVLWERRRFLWRLTLGALLIATLVAFLIPKRYQSTTRLMPPDTQSGSSMAMMAAFADRGNPILGGLAGDLLGVKSSGALFTDVLRSRTVEDRLIDRFDLRKVYHDRYWEDARKDLTKYTMISEDRKSGVITIAVSDHDPRRAAELAQAYVDELDRLVAEVSTSSARRQRIFIEQRLQTVKQGLDNVSRQFSEYASKNTTIDITAQAKATVEAAAKLEGELIAAQSELEGLEQIYATNNVRVRAMQARVDELRAQLHKIGGEDSDPPRNNSLVADRSSQEFPSIRQLPLLGVRWADLYRETKIQETVYELLTQQYELAKIEEAKEIPVVKILDAANVPEKKSSPHRLQLMILGTLLGFGVGSAWVLTTAAWRRLDAQNPRKQLVQEVVATSTALLSRLVTRWHTVVRPKNQWRQSRRPTEEPE
jgi:capsule polysaccharide export protein KpsE/RkpR